VDGADNSGGVKNGNDDGSGGCGGGTISNSKETWSGTEGLINGKSIVYSLIKGIGSADFNLYFYNEITQNEDNEEQILITPCAGGWKSDGSAKGALISADTRAVMKFFGQNATLRGAVGGTFYDHAGGGAGYYGGECSNHNNGGASGGSAYADIEGKIKLVTNVKGYCGYDNGNGAEMLGKYGNGKIVISK